MLFAAMVIDALLGEARGLRIGAPHPVVLIGGMITWLERRLNAGDMRRLKGVAALAAIVAVPAAISVAIGLLPHGWIAEIVVAAILLAQRSLLDHVAAVAAGLRRSLPAGREAVSMIVGRDPDSLDQAGVARAAIESAAENFSDGVTAPIFWFAVAGLPGLVAYKAINTADSMIGHRSARYRDFGWAAARTDDLVNLIPARLTGALISIAGALRAGLSFSGVVGAAATALRVMWRDASEHRSPNAGWPEAAMAASLGIALAGPRRYGDLVVDDPYMNAGARRDAGPEDIDRAVRVLWQSWGVVLAGAALALAV